MCTWGRVKVLAAMLITVAAGAGCGTPAAEQGQTEALRVVGPLELHSLEPAMSDGFFTRLEVAETLVSSDMRGELEPGLSTAWAPSEDGRMWTFELPPGVSFHDGTEVTGEAVADSLRRGAEDVASPLAAVPLERIVGAGEEVRFELSAAYPSLPAVLTHYSAAVLAPGSYGEGGEVTDVVGIGPYRIDTVELPARIEVRRFEDWRGDRPDIEQISFQAAGRAEARALMAVSDQADVVFGLEPAGRSRVDAVDGVSMESSLQPRSVLMKVNADHPILGDVRVRRALSLALDREAMAEAVLREPELAATQLFPPSLDAWHEEGLDPLAHDSDAAGRLLDAAGWAMNSDGARERDGEQLQLTLTTYPDRPELPALATAIQASVKEVGIDLQVEVTNSSEIPAGHEDGTLELGLLARHLALVSDPLVTVADTFAPDGADFGAMNWSDPAVTGAIDRLVAGKPPARADRDRARVAAVAQRELPLIPVSWYRMNAAVSDRVLGFAIDPLERTWRLSDVRWAA